MRPDSADFDPQRALAEFADLNRRRLFGSPSLEVPEVERWLALRTRLVAHFGSRGPEDWSGVERRQFLRLPVRIPVELSAGDSITLATVREISQGGLFVATQAPLEKGNRIGVRLSAGSDEEPMQISTVVAWVRTERSGARAPGVGVEFVELRPEQRDLVSRLVQRAASGD